jgi:hypothetical protein
MNAFPKLYEEIIFDASGFAVFGNALGPAEVAEARSELTQIFDQPPDASLGDSALVRTHVLARFPKLRRLILQPRVIEPLRLLLGENFVILPDNTATHSRYSGWHKDTHGFERFGYTFHHDPDYLCVTSLIYLQDNEAEYGGGLEVVSGSHAEPDRYRHAENPATHGRLYKLGDAAYPPEAMELVESHAGDLVLFNDKLDHSGAWPRSVPRPADLYDAAPPAVPPEKRKFMFSMAGMPNNRHVQSYLDYYKFLKTKFHEYKAMGRPYDQETLALARSLGFTLLSQ